MCTAIIALTLIAAVAAEAPYYSDRPSGNAPSFNYPSQPAPAPHNHAPPAPAPQYPAPPAPQYPAPSPQYPAPAPQYPAPSPQYPAPAPQYPAPAPQYPAPAPQYPAPAPQYPAPAPPTGLQYVQYPPTVNVIAQPQPQYQQPPYNYERPSIAPAFLYPQQQLAAVRAAPQSHPAAIQLPSQPQQQVHSHFAPQQSYSHSHASQQSLAGPAPQAYQQQFRQALPAHSAQVSFQSEPQYNYAQPQDNGQHSQLQHAQQLQAQSASGASSSLNQQSLVLDNHVVHRLSNILAQNEENHARNLGSYQRVSGVSLESANPSIEISSFVQNVPFSAAHASALSQTQSVSSSHELARGSSQQGAAESSLSGTHSSLTLQSSGAPTTGLTSSYGLPTVVDNRQSAEQTNYNFLPPQNQPPPSAYGPPK